MAKNTGMAVLRTVIAVVLVGAAAFLFTTGSRWLNENNPLQRSAKIALDDYVNSAKEFPAGEYVSLNTRWVIGPFATETSTSTTNGIKATSGVAYYYFLVLEDETVMAAKTENVREREVLDRMSDWLLAVDGYPMNGETLTLQGKLSKMTDKDTVRLYNENLYSVFGLSANDPAVRYLVLDTTAGRGAIYFIIAGGAAVLILAFVLIGKNRKKARARAQAAPEEPQGTAGTPGSPA